MANWRAGISLALAALTSLAATVLTSSTTSAQATKPRAATVTGRIVDNICMLGAGLKGDEHRECAIGCDRAGVRMALLDEQANVLYTLMADRPFVDPNGLIREHIERVVTIKGDLYDAPGGQKVLAVKEVLAGRGGK
jgi:hypothetical protein